MGQEFELKFSANATQQEAIRESYGPWQTIEMETTYYDTPGGDLSARHITLRRRMENGVSICTMKTPMGKDARGEWECQCNQIGDALAQFSQSGAPEDAIALAKEGLVVVCGARFTRLACALTLDGGAAELALDKGILIGGGRETPLCEVEVELKEGSREAVVQFAGILAASHGLQPERRSKFRRALSLAQGENA